MSAGQEFWIVASGCAKTGDANRDKQDLLNRMKSCSALNSKNSEPCKFDVPDGERSLIFGSFDNLIRLTDDLQKADSQVDSISHRLERQCLELDPKTDFKVKSQRQEKSFSEYLRNWTWDEAKYPKPRSISDNLTLLMSVVNKLDEEARNKTAQYNEFKTQRGNLAKKEGANMASRDLVDVLTPDVVTMRGSPEDDFIYTEHLTTIVVIVPRGTDEEFQKSYESFADHVVPMSAKQFVGLDDKDGNTLWRVVLFKGAAEQFKKQCREHRFIARDFEYSRDGFEKLKEHRARLEDAVSKQHQIVRELYQAAWSDVMVAWIHLKAMRVFVESVLRFGMPPRFAAFIVSPKTGSGTAARKALVDLLAKGAQGAKDKGATDAQDEGEYYPYVSLSFTPFNAAH